MAMTTPPTSAVQHDSASDRDPVCGMTVKPTTPHRANYGGREYLFCSAGCLRRFNEDPEGYLAPRPPAPPERTVAGTEWTCPMHPQIVREKPGSCPFAAWPANPGR
jgi:Cu+-exporting ATPase